MYRKGFWTGLLVGLVLAGVAAACLAGLVMLRARGMLVPALGLRLRSFGWMGHAGRLTFGMPARGVGGLLCLPLLLLGLGAAVVATVFAAHRCWRRGCGHSHRDEQNPAKAETPQTKEVGSEPEIPSEQPPAQG